MEASHILVYLAGLATGITGTMAYTFYKRNIVIAKRITDDTIDCRPEENVLPPGVYKPNKRGELEFYSNEKEEEMHRKLLEELAEEDQGDSMDEITRRLRVRKRG